MIKQEIMESFRLGEISRGNLAQICAQRKASFSTGALCSKVDCVDFVLRVYMNFIKATANFVISNKYTEFNSNS